MADPQWEKELQRIQRGLGDRARAEEDRKGDGLRGESQAADSLGMHL